MEYSPVQKLITIQLVKKFIAFCGTLTFIIVFTTLPPQRPLSSADESIPQFPTLFH
jgi:hypothetical protein